MGRGGAAVSHASATRNGHEASRVIDRLEEGDAVPALEFCEDHYEPSGGFSVGGPLRRVRSAISLAIANETFEELKPLTEGSLDLLGVRSQHTSDHIIWSKGRGGKANMLHLWPAGDSYGRFVGPSGHWFDDPDSQTICGHVVSPQIDRAKRSEWRVWLEYNQELKGPDGYRSDPDRICEECASRQSAFRDCDPEEADEPLSRLATEALSHRLKTALEEQLERGAKQSEGRLRSLARRHYKEMLASDLAQQLLEKGEGGVRAIVGRTSRFEPNELDYDDLAKRTAAKTKGLLPHQLVSFDDWRRIGKDVLAGKLVPVGTSSLNGRELVAAHLIEIIEERANRIAGA